MIKQLSILLLCLFAFFFAFCQDTSLLTTIAKKEDTAKVEGLITYAKEVMGNDNGKAEKIFQSALKISRSTGYWKGMGTCLLNLGAIDQQSGRYVESIEKFREGIVCFEKIHQQRGIAACMANIGTTHEMTGNRDSAIVYYMKAAGYFETSGYYYELATVYNNIGLLHSNNLNERKGLEYAEKAIQIASQYKELPRMNQALVLAFIAKSRNYSNLGDHQKELLPAYEAMTLAKEMGIKYYLAEAHERLSAALLQMNKPDSAIIHAKEAMKDALESDYFHTYINAALRLSSGYDKTGRQRERLEVLLSLLDRSKKSGTVLLMDHVYESLADVSYKLGQFKNAYDYHTEFSRLKDSMFSEQSAKTLAEAEARYQTARKEKALSEKQLQLSRQNLALEKSNRYVWIAVAGFLIASLLAACSFFYARSKKRTYKAKLLTFQKQKEIDMLQVLMQGEEKERSRIAKDLHDGVAGMLAAVKMHFSSLPSADDLMGAEGYRQGMQLLNEATLEIRKTSHNLMPEMLLQHGLDEALRRYCNSVSNSKALQIRYDSWGEIDRFVDSFELSVYRIVQELLNNILKHSKATQAMIQLSQQEDLLSVSIEDNGVGFVQANTGATDGMGLRSLQNRVKAINGKIELQASEQSGVSAYLEFEVADLVKGNSVAV